MRRISEKTVIGDGRVKEGSLRRRRGGRRNEKGMIRRMWKIGSIEDSSDVPEPVARVCESDLGAIFVGSLRRISSSLSYCETV